MFISSDIWRLLAGIAIFLLGMNFMEEGLRRLAGRPFKLFLKKQTSHKIKGVAGGIIVTGILQSSSIVNLMILAFVGAGVIQMQNALAVILGANLGTTLNSWIVATVGFNFSIESFALPIAGVSGIAMMLVNKESRWHHWCKLLFGFSFLFVGLNYIKSGVEETVQQVDIGSLAKQPAIVFLLIGLLITSLLQSSSATLAIVLSALYANAINLYSATAIVLGSEIGTTIKLVVASVGGTPAKKRVALGNLLFNLINTGVIFIFLFPVNKFITGVIGLNDNLIALVFFQSFINVTSIIMFYPFLGFLGKFLERRFVRSNDENLFINEVKITDTDLAIETLERQTHYFIYQTLSFAASAFETQDREFEKILSKNFLRKTLKEKYEYIKAMHGEIHRFSIRVQNVSSVNEDLLRTGQMISCTRNCMYAAKNVRDALHDIEQLHNSSNDTKYNFYLRTKDKVISFYKQVRRIIEQQNSDKNFENITELFRATQQGYTQSLQELYKEGIAKGVNQDEISTLINFNREIYTAFKSYVFALKDYLLDSKHAGYFEDLPGFIR